MVKTGLEVLLSNAELLNQAGRLGLLYNQASVDRLFRPSPELISKAFTNRLTTLFGPQHGVGGTEQDNMIETNHQVHEKLGIPIYSLYSTFRKPTPEMLEQVDTVLVDIQDVGTRVYTFATTVLFLMESCAELGKAVIILDRPNPIGGLNVEGNLLEPEYASFVGPYPIPMRHGLTIGELMNFYNSEFGIKCNLQVVPMSGWKRRMYFEETHLPWVLPSPNMPSVETAIVYPGQVLLEGTNLSEGRGTTKPFEIFGAPYVQWDKVIKFLEKQALEGIVLRETTFKPTFNKWQGQICKGFQIHVMDRNLFRPYRFSLSFLSSVLNLYPERFAWSQPPYEYVYDKLPIDVIIGSEKVRKSLEQKQSVKEIEREWERDLNDYMKVRSKYLLYDA